MDDLAERFSEIIEDKSLDGHEAHVDENNVKWTYARIETITKIPERTVRRMVAKVRNPEGAAAAVVKRDKDREAIVRSLRNRPAAVAEAIAELPVEHRQALNEQVTRKVISNRSGKPTVHKERLEARNASSNGEAIVYELGKADAAITKALSMWGVGEISGLLFEEATELLDRISMALEGFKAHDWDGEF